MLVYCGYALGKEVLCVIQISRTHAGSYVCKKRVIRATACLQRVDAEPTASAGGGAEVFKGVLPLMVRGSWFMVQYF